MPPVFIKYFSYRRIFCAAFLLFVFHSASANIANPNLVQLDSLVNGGAFYLAIHWIDQHQPSVKKELPDWLEWEKRRYRIYRRSDQWPIMHKRAEEYKDILPATYHKWLFAEAAQAATEAGDHQAALHYLRTLIWHHQNSEEELARWFRLVIRNYLESERMEDAEVALGRYMQTYRITNNVWKLIHARVLIGTKQYREAYDLLPDVQSREGRFLQLLAALRMGLYSAESVLKRGEDLYQAYEKKPDMQFRIAGLMVEAAAKQENAEAEVISLERLMASTEDVGSEHLFSYQPDRLWQAYEKLAEEIGNSSRILVGDDQAWLKKIKGFKSTSPAKMRAGYVLLAFNARSQALREQAHAEFVQSLLDEGYMHAIRRLYMESGRFKDREKLPPMVRYRLALTVLQDFDMQLAAELVENFKRAPEGVDQWYWSLRRARILLYAGQQKEALSELDALSVRQSSFTEQQVERYVQVLFDLQVLHRHEDAFRLLHRLYGLAPVGRHQREILYWMADSKTALMDYVEASQLYLQSATYEEHHGNDMWGMSARYRAAESLTEAGLIDDAYNIYQYILRLESDASQKAQIERKIQQLWLLKQKNSAQSSTHLSGS